MYEKSEHERILMGRAMEEETEKYEINTILKKMIEIYNNL